MITPFKNYLGGKGSAGTYHKIINEIPPYKRLIIPFGGNCAVTRHIKKDQTIELMDMDSEVIEAWHRELKNNAEYSHKINLWLTDSLEFISKMITCFDSETVVYCDPPYLQSTRTDKRTRYKYNFGSVGSHVKLLKLLLQCKCPVLISSYPNELYKEMLEGWRVKRYYATTRGKSRLELLYMNFTNPNKLMHDYSLAGNNFRERERISKKVKRFNEKLYLMKPLDRNAVLNSLTDFIDNTNGVELITREIIAINGDSGSERIYF